MYLSKDADPSVIDLMATVTVGSVPTILFKESVKLVHHYTNPKDTNYLTDQNMI
jgi:hypothetical protein